MTLTCNKGQVPGSAGSGLWRDNEFVNQIGIWWVSQNIREKYIAIDSNAFFDTSREWIKERKSLREWVLESMDKNLFLVWLIVVEENGWNYVEGRNWSKRERWRVWRWLGESGLITSLPKICSFIDISSFRIKRFKRCLRGPQIDTLYVNVRSELNQPLWYLRTQVCFDAN